MNPVKISVHRRLRYVLKLILTLVGSLDVVPVPQTGWD